MNSLVYDIVRYLGATIIAGLPHPRSISRYRLIDKNPTFITTSLSIIISMFGQWAWLHNMVPSSVADHVGISPKMQFVTGWNMQHTYIVLCGISSAGISAITEGQSLVVRQFGLWLWLNRTDKTRNANRSHCLHMYSEWQNILLYRYSTPDRQEASLRLSLCITRYHKLRQSTFYSHTVHLGPGCCRESSY